MGEDPNQRGSSRRWLTRAVEDSLRRLQTDYIDLFQMHRPAPDTDLEETLSVLTDLMRAGKVRAIGASTFPASEIVEAQWVAERRGLARFRTEQPPYSILNRSIEREVLPDLSALRHGRHGLEPAGQGHAHRPVPPGRAAAGHAASQYFPKAMSDERSLDAVEQLIPLAQGAGISLMHMAVAFVAAQPALTSAIIGPRTMEQLDGCSPAPRWS